MQRVLKPGDIAIDAGANNGFFSLVMSKLVGPAGCVVAFEPSTNNCKRLERNIDLNDAFNVGICEQPLWSKPEAIDFHYYEHDGSASHYRFSDAQAIKLRATTLETWFGNLSIALVKMDIEGSEYDALLGAPSLLARHTPVIAECNHEMLDKAGNGRDAVHNLMKANGYERFSLDPAGGLPRHLPWACQLNTRFANTNILYATLEDVARMWPEVEL